MPWESLLRIVGFTSAHVTASVVLVCGHGLAMSWQMRSESWSDRRCLMGALSVQNFKGLPPLAFCPAAVCVDAPFMALQGDGHQTAGHLQISSWHLLSALQHSSIWPSRLLAKT